MAAQTKLNATKCSSCRIVLMRQAPVGGTCQLLCSACSYLPEAHSPRHSRPHSLLPTVEVTDTSQDSAAHFYGSLSATSNSGSSSSILASVGNIMPSHGLYRRQDSRGEYQTPGDLAGTISPCSSSSGSNSPTQPSSWLPLPRVAAFPLGMGSIRRHSYQLIEAQSASTPSRYIQVYFVKTCGE